MSEKKYYWMKVKRDFCKRYDISIMLGEDDGYIYFYLYMFLLCESIKHEGILMYSETKPYTPKMISRLTHIDEECIKAALEYFQESELMTIGKNGELIFSELDGMVGVDTENARKQKRYRERKKDTESNEKSNTVTEALPNRYTEKEKEKEKEIELEKEKVIDKSITFLPTSEKILPTTDEFLKFVHKKFGDVSVDQLNIYNDIVHDKPTDWKKYFIEKRRRLVSGE